MTFVSQIDEYLYLTFTPYCIQKMIEEIPPLQMPIEDLTKKETYILSQMTILPWVKGFIWAVLGVSSVSLYTCDD